jgi:hypothetical protein
MSDYALEKDASEAPDYFDESTYHDDFYDEV